MPIQCCICGGQVLLMENSPALQRAAERVCGSAECLAQRIRRVWLADGWEATVEIVHDTAVGSAPRLIAVRPLGEVPNAKGYAPGTEGCSEGI